MHFWRNCWLTMQLTTIVRGVGHGRTFISCRKYFTEIEASQKEFWLFPPLINRSIRRVILGGKLCYLGWYVFMGTLKSIEMNKSLAKHTSPRGPVYLASAARTVRTFWVVGPSEVHATSGALFLVIFLTVLIASWIFLIASWIFFPSHSLLTFLSLA